MEAACEDILEASFSSPVGVSYHTSKNYPAFFCIAYLQGNTKVIVHEGFLLGMCVCFSSLQFTTRTPVGKTQKCKSEQIRGHYWPLLRQTKSVKKLSQSWFSVQWFICECPVPPNVSFQVLIMMLQTWYAQCGKIICWRYLVLRVGWKQGLGDLNSIFCSTVDAFYEIK